MAGKKSADRGDASSSSVGKSASNSKFSTKRSKVGDSDKSSDEPSFFQEDISLSNQDSENASQNDENSENSENSSTESAENSPSESESETESKDSEASDKDSKASGNNSKDKQDDFGYSYTYGSSSSASYENSSEEASSKDQETRHDQTTSTSSDSSRSSSEESVSEDSNSDFSVTQNTNDRDESSESSVPETSKTEEPSKGSETYSRYSSYNDNDYEDEPLLNKRNIAIIAVVCLIVLAIILFFIYSPHQTQASTTTIPVIVSIPPLITVSSIKVNGLVVNLVGAAVAKTQGALIDYNKSTIDWNDGNVTSFSNVQHTYSNYKNYTIKLTVYDTLENKNSTVVYVRLTPQYLPSLVVFSHINGTTVKLNGTALPNPAVQSEGAIISQVQIAWGDGMVTDGRTQYIHTYKSAGTYSIAITAIDNLGNKNTVFKNVSVYPLTFGSSSNYPSSICQVPPSVILNNPKIQGLRVWLSGVRSNSVTGGTINWGDGNVTSIDQYFHTYSTVGIYTASVNVYDQCNDKNSFPVYVQTQ